MGFDYMDLEDAVAHAMPPELDTAYPGVRDRLLAELAYLRRYKAAMEKLEERALYVALKGGGKVVAVTIGVRYHAIRSDGSWTKHSTLLAAIEAVKEG